MPEMPLVSFCVKSYNQKRYLIEALKGAFAQTYRPLEIVISDDGSTDGSWEYIQQAVAEFKQTHDDVPVVINRNQPNLGNLGNWQKCCELAHGELLVKADGDDISLPERTSVMVKRWIDGGKKAKLISCGGIQIDPQGRSLGPVKGKELFGAFCAYTRDLFTTFPDRVGNPRAIDDTLYVARARMLGDIVHIPDRLVRYRIGSGVSSCLLDVRAPFRRCVPLVIPAIRQAFADVRYLRSAGRSVAPELVRSLSEDLRMDYDFAVLEGGNTMSKRLAAFRRIQRVSRIRWLSAVGFHRACLVLPRQIGDVFLFLYSVLNYMRKLVVNRSGADA